jgi:hypothetical protein
MSDERPSSVPVGSGLQPGDREWLHRATHKGDAWHLPARERRQRARRILAALARLEALEEFYAGYKESAAAGRIAAAPLPRMATALSALASGGKP